MLSKLSRWAKNDKVSRSVFFGQTEANSLTVPCSQALRKTLGREGLGPLKKRLLGSGLRLELGNYIY